MQECIRDAFVLKEDVLKTPFYEEKNSSFPSNSSYTVHAGMQMGVLFRLTDDFIEMTRAGSSEECHNIVMEKTDSYFGEGKAWNRKSKE